VAGWSLIWTRLAFAMSVVENLFKTKGEATQVFASLSAHASRIASDQELLHLLLQF
jgi:hypothetical protein